MITHTLGYPRIGANRELKWACEKYWRGDISQAELESTGKALRLKHWQDQAEAGLDYVAVGDFSFYDQVLDLSCLLGNVPQRFGPVDGQVDLDTFFRMARGRAPSGTPAAACEMTKWFDTNYHYIVPEFDSQTRFRLSSDRLFDQVEEARAAGFNPKPVLLGPVSYLRLGKVKSAGLSPLDLLDELVSVYGQILQRLSQQGVQWVQIDEPILVLDLTDQWRQAFESAYSRLGSAGPKILLTTYFGELQENLSLACRLPVAGLHLDAVRGNELLAAADQLPDYKVLSVGIVDGRNVWRNDLEASLDKLEPLYARLGERLWLAPSCSLLHVPVDVSMEEGLDPKIRSWLSFAKQKLIEVTLLAQALTQGRAAIADQLEGCRQAITSRKQDERTYVEAVRQRVSSIQDNETRRHSPYPVRREAQRRRFKLPILPTTTIGSFPQTPEIRSARRAWKQGELDNASYQEAMRREIAHVIKKQLDYGLDVLVHGEPERNDMVEYFGEQLEGYTFTANGWVQSYGSRCVKPPIIFGDVSRPKPMTVSWSKYAQSLTDKPVKGMLTGPVTMLQWAFVRDDLPRQDVAMQIALALRDEVMDLESAGIGIIQIDEPAFREGLPLRKADWPDYLAWAVRAFRVSASGVRDDTQIHTHMCYSEFNDIIEAIAELDADVITIETSRSDMELLDAFENFDYPNEIGPGVYDIHSPNIPSVESMVRLMEKAIEKIPVERLWINPDCGLKTRQWAEVDPALINMVEAARQLRASVTTATS